MSMTLEQRQDFFRTVIFEQMIAVAEVATREYSTENNVFTNFERLSVDLKISREQVLWVYLRKHLDGIVSYINGFTSQREPVEGRIKDAMVYLGLLWCMVADSQAAEHNALQPLVDRIEIVLKRRGWPESQARLIAEEIEAVL